MKVAVKKHTRTAKNKVTVVRKHARATKHGRGQHPNSKKYHFGSKHRPAPKEPGKSGVSKHPNAAGAFKASMEHLKIHAQKAQATSNHTQKKPGHE